MGTGVAGEVFAIQEYCSRAPVYTAPVSVSQISLTAFVFVLLCRLISVFCASMGLFEGCF